jgi:outer membrane immunogenic protein
VANPANPNFAEAYTASKEFRDHVFRMGLNYRLGGAAAATPVAFAAATHDWRGFYLGGNVGYGVARNHVASKHFNDIASRPQESFTLSPAGALGGAQAGYNWQIARNWVAGVEADGQWSAQKDSSCTDSCNFIPQANAAGEAVSIEQKLRWLATARVRVGYAVGGWLAYVTGGAAWGGIRDNILTNVNADRATTQLSHSKGGGTIGTGIETALGGRWTAKLEYLYVDLGSVTDFAANGPGFGSAKIHTQLQDHIVRFGLNYNFSQPSVVARY